MDKQRETKVSEHVARTVRLHRKARKWSGKALADELHDHRCADGYFPHAEGYAMSPAVISTMEHGVSAQHGYPPRQRIVSVDDLVALAHVFGIEPEDLLYGD